MVIVAVPIGAQTEQALARLVLKNLTPAERQELSAILDLLEAAVTHNTN